MEDYSGGGLKLSGIDGGGGGCRLGAVVRSMELKVTRRRLGMLVAFAAAALLLMVLQWHVAGTMAWITGFWLAWGDEDRAVRRRMGLLFGCVGLLAACNINTSTEWWNFVQLGVAFGAVIVVPALVLRRTDPGVIRYRLVPVHWRWADVVYTILSVPLAWLILKGYWAVNPELYTHWSLPEELDQGEIRRLFIGINGVGIWDELFFVNTVFGVLRSLFRFRVANAVQAVIYMAVLHDMAFTGIGPLVVYAFAWTQGSMFEKSEGLLWVLIVHLVVDFFLVAAIVGSYYPGVGMGYLWTHGM